MPINHLHPRLCCTPLVDWTDINKDELHRGWPEILSLHIKESVPPPPFNCRYLPTQLCGVYKNNQYRTSSFFLFFLLLKGSVCVRVRVRCRRKDGWMGLLLLQRREQRNLTLQINLPVGMLRMMRGPPIYWVKVGRQVGSWGYGDGEGGCGVDFFSTYQVLCTVSLPVKTWVV